VNGMIEIYKTWIGDFGVDGFRIDTMNHVNDEFWQKFGPEVLAYAKSQDKNEFFMFGEVFDLSRPFTSTLYYLPSTAGMSTTAPAAHVTAPTSRSVFRRPPASRSSGIRCPTS
jgi:glycosidase